MSSSLEQRAQWESGILAFLHRQFLERRKEVPSYINLAGQTVLVTGANSGLGFEALRQLLQLGASRAILAIRTKASGDAAAARLRKEFPDARIDVMIVDMVSYPSIKAFVKECETLDRLDVVILNAGALFTQFQRNEATGHELTLQVNYISTILLSALLLPVLKSKKRQDQPARLTVIASDTAYWNKVNPTGPIIPQFDRDLQTKFDAFGAYGNAKFVLIAGMIKLASAVSANDVIVNMANPGLCYGTKLGHEGQPAVLTFIVDLLKRVVGRNSATGASTYLDAAVVQGPESHGSFMSDWTVKPYPPILYTDQGRAMTERLWEDTLETLRGESISEALAQLKN